MDQTPKFDAKDVTPARKKYSTPTLEVISASEHTLGGNQQATEGGHATGGCCCCCGNTDFFGITGTLS